MIKRLIILVVVLIVTAVLLYGGYRVARRLWRMFRSGERIDQIFVENTASDSNIYISQWLTDDSSRTALNTGKQHLCDDAPFLLPSVGFVGLLWRDSASPYSLNKRHPGVDIFGDGAPGTVPIVAAYDGWLTRDEDWKSTVAIRHDDPLQPGRTIWTYYTHMANREGNIDYIVDAFPQGTYETFVKQGTLLGYQGLYAGSTPGSWIAMHAHVSVVLSGPDGELLNEAILSNTIDPSPYFGLTLNSDTHPDRPIRCEK